MRKQAEKVRLEDVNIPRDLYQRLKEVTHCTDVIGLPFFVTLSRRIKLVTIEFLPSRTAKQLCKSFQRSYGYIAEVALLFALV
jgi:hypothetical protein